MARKISVLCLSMALAVCAIAFGQQIEKHETVSLGSVQVARDEIHVEAPLGILAVPWHINYQGYLTDDAGVPLNDTLSMTFGIWDAASAGTELWIEGQSVAVEEGLFNVILGSITPIPWGVFQAGASRWLELTVDVQTLSPRTEVASVGYAYRAVISDSTDAVDGFDASAAPTANDLFPLVYGDSRYVNEGQADAVTSGMVLDGGLTRDDVADTFKAPFADTADYALAAPASPDNDWTIMGNVAYLSGSYGLGMRSFNTLYGIYDSTHVNFGIQCTTGTSGENRGFSTVSGGFANSAAYDYAVVGGGSGNRATGYHSVISGGESNTAGGQYVAIGGGRDNIVNVNGSTVAGGGTNTVPGDWAFIGGGWANHAVGTHSVIGGGYSDTVNGHYGAVLSGHGCAAGDAVTDTGAVVAGGWGNSANGKYSFVGGGNINSAGGDYSYIGGGTQNSVSASWSSIPGGYGNTCAASDGFAATSSSTVLAGHSSSAAFNGQTTTSSAETHVGLLTKVAGAFTIDHPLDPENKILNHYFVESPEMVLIYRGSAVIGSDGLAEVHLPVYFDALNKSPMVQLTGVGTFEVFVAEKVDGNRFVIGGKPGTEVYWTVTGDRKDQSAEVARTLKPVEQPKQGGLAGHSLDDDYLSATMMQLERMGEASRFSFRTATGRERFEQTKRRLSSK